MNEFIQLSNSLFLAAAAAPAVAPPKPGGLVFGWFDAVVILVLVIGLVVGRKRGMSNELFDFIKWVGVVVVCGLNYEPLGRLLAQVTGWRPMWACIGAYVGMLVLIMTIFSMFKHSVGKKLSGSDLFGGMEFYMGMGAGMIQFACILMVCLALVNARKYSQTELEASAKSQSDAFGSISFPTFGTVQKNIFRDSFTGPLIKKHLSMLLISPPTSFRSTFELPSGATGKKRESDVDAVMGGKK